MRETKPPKEDERPFLRREDCVSIVIGGVLFGFSLRMTEEGRPGEGEPGGVEGGWTSVDMVVVGMHDKIKKIENVGLQKYLVDIELTLYLVPSKKGQG